MISLDVMCRLVAAVSPVQLPRGPGCSPWQDKLSENEHGRYMLIPLQISISFLTSFLIFHMNEVVVWYDRSALFPRKRNKDQECPGASGLM